MIKKLDVNRDELEKNLREGFEFHDIIKDGASRDLHPVKTALLLMRMLSVINQLVEVVNEKSAQVENIMTFYNVPSNKETVTGTTIEPKRYRAKKLPTKYKKRG